MACDDGLLYAMSAVGLLKCFDAGTGDERWAVDVPKEYQGEPPGWGYSEAPVVFENKVIVSPGGQNGFVALDKKTGKTIWQCPEPKGHPGHSSSIVVDFRGHAIVVRLSGIGMAACDARTGKSLWINKRAVGGAAVATPVHWEGYVFGATAYNNGGACVKLGLEGDTVTATQVWETKEMQNHHGGFVVVDGYLYGNHLSGWTCIDMKTGEVKWYDDGVGKGSLAYADGMLYTYSEGAGRIGLVEATPTGYRRTGEFSVRGRNNSWPHPVIINGRLYLRYWDTLYCFDVTRGRP
jgi:outer membrane protein assembly factor BamB